MLLSISQLAEMTGRERRTITKKLDALPFVVGEKGGHQYDSVEALAKNLRLRLARGCSRGASTHTSGSKQDSDGGHSKEAHPD